MNPQACGLELIALGVIAVCAWCKKRFGGK
jgi:hypothetical protein